METDPSDPAVRAWGDPAIVAVLRESARVALDVARVLAKHAEDLLPTEIPANVQAGLEASAVTDVHVFGQALLIALSKTYALRMAAVFMMSLATIWLKTGLVSRGLVIFTYVVALTLLVASDVTVWLTLAFPVWVLIVSVLALSKAGLIDLHRDGD